MGTKYFPMFHSYLETLAGLTDEQFGRVIRAALRYSVNGVVPDLSGAEAMAFGFIKMDVDRAREKYEAIAERNRVNGMKGGRPKKSEENPVGYLGTQKTQRNPEKPKKPIETATEKAKEKANAKGTSTGDADGGAVDGRRKSAGFVRPTEEDVAAYCVKMNYTHVDAAEFVAYYEERNWIAGDGEPMKNWKSVVRGWEQRNRNKPAPRPAASSFDTDEFFDAALQRTYGDNWKFFKEGGEQG